MGGEVWVGLASVSLSQHLLPLPRPSLSLEKTHAYGDKSTELLINHCVTAQQFPFNPLPTNTY